MTRKTTEEMMAEIEYSIKPYRKDFKTFTRLPKDGRKKEEIIKEMEALNAKEEPKWKDGFVSGAVYHGDEDHIDFLNQVYVLNSQSNPLHTDVWPSTTKFEAEVVAMTANMLNADKVTEDPDSDDEVGGVAEWYAVPAGVEPMKTYRDWARDMRGISKPEMIVPKTAHAAFDKASQYFNINMKRIRLIGGGSEIFPQMEIANDQRVEFSAGFCGWCGAGRDGH